MSKKCVDKYGVITLKFGKYRGVCLKNVPKDYLQWAVSLNILKGRALQYARVALGIPKNIYEIIVEDAVVGNGVYKIKGYDPDDALRNLMWRENIQNTQSYDGTSYKIKLMETSNE